MDEATFLRILDALAVAITSLERRVIVLEQGAQQRGRPCVQVGCTNRLATDAPRTRRYCDACAAKLQRERIAEAKRRARQKLHVVGGTA